jgi:hypothetical protein
MRVTAGLTIGSRKRCFHGQLLKQGEIVQFSEMCRPKSSWTQGQCLLLTQRGHRDGYHGHGWSYACVHPMYG